MADGIADGIAEATRNLAKKMLASGIAVELISKVTNLDPNYIVTL